MTYKDKGSYESSLPCIECHSWSNCALSHNTVHTNQYTSTTQLLSTTLRVIELFSFPHHRDIELHFISRSNGTIPEYQHMILLKDIFRAVCGFFIDFFEHKCWFTALVTFGWRQVSSVVVCSRRVLELGGWGGREIHICIHACIYMYIYIYIYIYTSMYAYICIVLKMCGWGGAYIYIYVFISTNVHINVSIYIYIHTYIYMPLHIHIYGLGNGWLRWRCTWYQMNDICIYIYIHIYIPFRIYINIYRIYTCIQSTYIHIHTFAYKATREKLTPIHTRMYVQIYVYTYNCTHKMKGC